MSLEILAKLNDALEFSSLPIVVDVSRYEDLTPTFQDLVKAEGATIS